jgi:hypothetical protein
MDVLQGRVRRTRAGGGAARFSDKKARQRALLRGTLSRKMLGSLKKVITGKDFYCEKKANVLASFLWIWKL